MQLSVDDDSVQIRLALWQKVLGLMRNITIRRAEIERVEVIEDSMRPALQSGIKVGLRLPWLYYVARTIRLDEAFIVRRGVPALVISVNGQSPLRRVFLSTPDAADLAARLGRA